MKKNLLLLIVIVLALQSTGCANKESIYSDKQQDVTSKQSIQEKEKSSSLQQEEMDDKQLDSAKRAEEKGQEEEKALEVSLVVDKNEETGYCALKVKINEQEPMLLTMLYGDEMARDLSEEVSTEQNMLLSGCISRYYDDETDYYIAYPKTGVLQYWERQNDLYAQGEFRLMRQVLRDEMTQLWQVEIPECQTVVADDFLLGGKFYDHWATAEEVSLVMSEETTYQLYDQSAKSLGEYKGQLHKGNGIEAAYIAFDNAKRYSVAISGANWQAFPRTWQALDTNASVYKKIVSEYLKANDLEITEPNITQLYRVDLEGDGVDEVLITATSYEGDYYSPFSSYGDYSIVLLRKIVEGEVKTIPIFKFISNEKEPEEGEMPIWYTSNLINCIDVDGDGQLEVINSWQYYEGYVNTIWKVDNGELIWYSDGGFAV